MIPSQNSSRERLALFLTFLGTTDHDEYWLSKIAEVFSSGILQNGGRPKLDCTMMLRFMSVDETTWSDPDSLTLLQELAGVSKAWGLPLNPHITVKEVSTLKQSINQLDNLDSFPVNPGWIRYFINVATARMKERGENLPLDTIKQIVSDVNAGSCGWFGKLGPVKASDDVDRVVDVFRNLIQCYQDQATEFLQRQFDESGNKIHSPSFQEILRQH